MVIQEGVKIVSLSSVPVKIFETVFHCLVAQSGEEQQHGTVGLSKVMEFYYKCCKVKRPYLISERF